MLIRLPRHAKLMLHKHAAQRWHLELLLLRIIRVLSLLRNNHRRGILILLFGGERSGVGRRGHDAAGAAGPAGAGVFVVRRVVVAAAGALGFGVEGAEGG